MFQTLLVALMMVLFFNLLVALFSVYRRPRPDRWLLVVLLSGTSGAALLALLAVLLDSNGAANEQFSRFSDPAIVLIGLTALTAAVRVTARRSSRRRTVSEEPGS